MFNFCFLVYQYAKIQNPHYQPNISPVNLSLPFCQFPRGKIFTKIFAIYKFLPYYCRNKIKQKMSTDKNKSTKKLKEPTKSRIKSVFGTLLETSKLLQGSTAGKVASISAKASIIIGAIYAIVEIFI